MTDEVLTLDAARCLDCGTCRGAGIFIAAACRPAAAVQCACWERFSEEGGGDGAWELAADVAIWGRGLDTTPQARTYTSQGIYVRDIKATSQLAMPTVYALGSARYAPTVTADLAPARMLDDRSLTFDTRTHGTWSRPLGEVGWRPVSFDEGGQPGPRAGAALWPAAEGDDGGMLLFGGTFAFDGETAALAAPGCGTNCAASSRLDIASPASNSSGDRLRLECHPCVFFPPADVWHFAVAAGWGQLRLDLAGQAARRSSLYWNPVPFKDWAAFEKWDTTLKNKYEPNWHPRAGQTAADGGWDGLPATPSWAIGLGQLRDASPSWLQQWPIGRGGGLAWTLPQHTLQAAATASGAVAPLAVGALYGGRTELRTIAPPSSPGYNGRHAYLLRDMWFIHMDAAADLDRNEGNPAVAVRWQMDWQTAGRVGNRWMAESTPWDGSGRLSAPSARVDAASWVLPTAGLRGGPPQPAESSEVMYAQQAARRGAAAPREVIWETREGLPQFWAFGGVGCFGGVGSMEVGDMNTGYRGRMDVPLLYEAENAAAIMALADLWVYTVLLQAVAPMRSLPGSPSPVAIAAAFPPRLIVNGLWRRVGVAAQGGWPAALVHLQPTTWADGGGLFMLGGRRCAPRQQGLGWECARGCSADLWAFDVATARWRAAPAIGSGVPSGAQSTAWPAPRCAGFAAPSLAGVVLGEGYVLANRSQLGTRSAAGGWAEDWLAVSAPISFHLR